jgi:hypothetical protein
LYNSINIVDVSSERHFEGEAVGEIDAFANSTKNTGIFSCYYAVRSQSQVPELYKEGLQGLYLEYFGESHTGKGIVSVHEFILLYMLDHLNKFNICFEY